MKIKTITCHDVYNYGASLQAYALLRYLESLGNEVEIIDYKPNYLNKSYNFWYVPKEHRFYNKCIKSPAFHFLYALRLLPITYKTWKRIIPFNSFKKNFLSCTKTYASLQELKVDPPVADIYIAGSDQIWNSNLDNGLDPAFYLSFGSPSIRRISYAASFAMQDLTSKNVDFYKSQLRKFNAISVREMSGLRILKKLGLSGKQVLDPVFLLDTKQWTKVAGDKPILTYNYVLVYNLYGLNSSLLREAAELFTQKKKLKIVSICDSIYCDFSDINIDNAGPREFVNYFKYASYIVTDSFHGVAFSLLFKKTFIVHHIHSDISRIRDLLCILNLEDLLNPSRKSLITINWDMVNNELGELIMDSKYWLNNILQSN